MSITEATTCWTSFGMVGVPMPEPESFSCSDPKVPDAQIRNSEVIKHTEQSSAQRMTQEPFPAGALSTAASIGCCSVPLPLVPWAFVPI